MGDVNLEIKLSNLDERVIKIEESGDGSGGDGYITSVSNDFNVVNKKLSLSNDVTTKLSKLNSDGTLDFSNVKSTPTSLSGYGIADAYTKTEVDANKIEKPASANDGQVLTYNATSDKWEAKDSQGSEIAYSTDEVKTNDVWIDGKPIYRKTVTSNVDKPTSIPLDLPNVKSIIKINATCRYGEGYQFLPIVSNQLNLQTVFYYDASAKAVKFAWGSGLSATVSDIIITFEYTKTTD